MNALLSLLVRIANGEKYRPARPEDYRQWFGVLALSPFFLAGIAFSPIGRKILNHESTGVVWLYLTLSMTLGVGVLLAWIRWIPAWVSLVVAVAAWGVGFWIAFNS